MLIFGLFKLGPKELIIVAVVLVLFFGAPKIRELAHGIRKAIQHLRGTDQDESH